MTTDDIAKRRLRGFVRTRRWTFPTGAAAAALCLAGYGLDTLAGGAPGSATTKVAGALMLAGGLAALACAALLVRGLVFRCPRCERPLFHAFYREPFQSRYVAACPRCGLKIPGDGEPDAGS